MNNFYGGMKKKGGGGINTVSYIEYLMIRHKEDSFMFRV